MKGIALVWICTAFVCNAKVTSFRAHEVLHLEEHELDDLTPVEADQENLPFPRPNEVTSGNETMVLDVQKLAFIVQGLSQCDSRRLIDKELAIQVLKIDNGVSDVTNEICQDVYRAFHRFRTQNLAQHFGLNGCTQKENCIDTINVELKDLKMNVMQFGVDESYTLKVTSHAIHIHASTVFGMYHGLQSLSQLLAFSFEKNQFIIPNGGWLISDAPRFSHRELLVDSARHFLPLKTLESVIDSLTYAKVNTFHWHLEDDQAFPVCFDSVPKLCELGSFSPEERYTSQDLKHIVEYARQRGIRVVPELDVPGHTRSWCNAYPKACVETHDMISPVGNKAEEIIHSLLAELHNIFPDKYIHLGGDEVDESTWSKSPTVQQYMNENGKNTSEIYYDFLDGAQNVTFSFGRIPVVWNDVFNRFRSAVDKRVVVNRWKEPSMKEITSAGYRVILSDQSKWYLDHLDVNWADAYSLDPFCFPCNSAEDQLTEEEQRLVIGGGGAMWGETVDTSDILQTVWPRMAAIAEKLWTKKELTESLGNAEERGVRFQCLLNRRGVAAAPLRNKNARQAPKGPSGCEAQVGRDKL